MNVFVQLSFFDLRIFSTYSWDQWCFPFSWGCYFFSIFSWDWCFFDFPELGVFFSVSFQIGLEINALLEFLEIFFYCFFRLSWYNYNLFSLQIIVFLRFPSLQIKFFSFFLILLCLWPTLNDSAPAVRLSSNAITLVYLNSFIFSWDYVLLRFFSLEISTFDFLKTSVFFYFFLRLMPFSTFLRLLLFVSALEINVFFRPSGD